MENVYKTAVELLQAGISFAYTAIISQDGSTPRGAGSKMLVLPDRIEATIGGGLMEAQVIDLARQEILPNRTTRLLTFDLSGAQAAKADFICGGNCEILLCYVDSSNPAHLELFRAAAGLVQAGGVGWLVTMLNGHTGVARLCLSLEGKELLGDYDAATMLPREQLLQPSRIALHSGDDPAVRYIVEPVHSGGTVYLFGAGHVSQQVARITNLLEFNTVVVDDRADFLTAERFPDCTLRCIDSFTDMPPFAVDGNSYLLIITRGHSHDETVMRWAMGQPYGYLGMIGSTQKRDRIYQNMVRDGYDAQQLATVHSPIGLPIGGQTPAEIAVSIAAELVQVRAQKTAR